MSMVLGILSFPSQNICAGKETLADIEDRFPQPSIEFNPESYICYRSEETIKINGLLDEKSWKEIEWTGDFIDIEGDSKPAPRFKTRVKMLWDDEFFYIGAELDEPHVWAKLTERDAVIFYDNDFEVFIDPDADTHQYYEFEVNAFGTEWDLFLVRPYRDGGPAVNAWDIQGLQTGIYVNGTLNNPQDTDIGWSLELAFPWKVLKECAQKETPPKSQDQWRVNFSRVEWETEVVNGEYIKTKDPNTGKALREDNWVWSPQGLVNMHYPEMWGIVQFSEQIAGSQKDIWIQKETDAHFWALRKIYYMERNYFEHHHTYSNQLEVLVPYLMMESAVNWSDMKIYISITLDTFVATLEVDKSLYHIDQSGRIW